MSPSQGFVGQAADRFDEAADWHAKWRDASGAGLPAEEVDVWAEWVKSPDNKLAYDAVAYASQARSFLEIPPQPTQDEFESDRFAGSVSTLQPSAEGYGARRVPVLRWRRASLFALAASVVAIGFLLAPRWLNLDKAEPVHIISTAAGETKTIALEDGSSVTLGARTELSVHYGRCLRTILLNNGEAFFSVAHDPNCPFIVIAGDGAVTAVGTSFTVRRTLDRVTVRVSEGIVNVSPRDALPSVPWPKDVDRPSVTWSSARLVPGQEVTYVGDKPRGPVETEDPHVATAWLEGRREYRNEPLAYVVADINRYFDKEIEVKDLAAGELKFTGRVYETQVTDWLRALETIFPVQVVEKDSGHILIESRDKRAGHGATGEP